MKRTVALLLALVLLLYLTGCGKPEEKGTSLDSDRRFIHYGLREGVCTTEDTVYFASGHLIHYYDKTTGISGVLCGKAECEHSTAYGSTCNAYINSSSDDLLLYAERLYWRNDDTIYSMALDGTDHRTERTLGRELFSEQGFAASMILHRGFAYVLIKNYWVEDGQEALRLDLAAVSLDPNGEVHMIFSEELDAFAASWGPFFTMQAYGDDLYILTSWAAEADELNGSPASYDFRILRYGAATQELTTLYYDSQSPIDYTIEMWVTDDSIVYYGYERQRDNDDARFFRFDFETGEIAGLIDRAGGGRLADDLMVSSKYTSEKSNPSNPWGLTLAPQDLERTGELRVVMWNFAGDVLVDDSYPLNGRFSIPRFRGADDAYAYFIDKVGDDISLIGVALDGSGLEVLCTEEEHYEYPSGGHSTSTYTLDDGTTIIIENDEKITIIPGDGGETVTMTIEELIEKGYQP